MQAHQGLGTRHAHFELHGDHRHARARKRHDMFGARHLREDLFGGYGHHLLHVGHAGTGEGNQHIGHGDVDLRLFFARRHQHGKRAEQQGHQRQQRRNVRALEHGRDPAGDSEVVDGFHISAPARQLGGRWPLFHQREHRSVPRPGPPGTAPDALGARWACHRLAPHTQR